MNTGLSLLLFNSLFLSQNGLDGDCLTSSAIENSRSYWGFRFRFRLRGMEMKEAVATHPLAEPTVDLSESFTTLSPDKDSSNAHFK